MCLKLPIELNIIQFCGELPIIYSPIYEEPSSELNIIYSYARGELPIIYIPTRKSVRLSQGRKNRHNMRETRFKYMYMLNGYDIDYEDAVYDALNELYFDLKEFN